MFIVNIGFFFAIQAIVSVVGAGHLAGPTLSLTPYGKIVERYIQGIPTTYSGVIVDKCTIMPNHVHTSQSSLSEIALSSLMRLIPSPFEWKVAV